MRGLFGAERLDWVQSGRPSRREITRQRSDAHHHDEPSGKSRRIRRRDSKQQPLKRSPEKPRSHEPKSRSDCSQGKGLFQNESLKTERGRPERHPDSDLLRSLIDRVRDDAVNSERGQNQREAGKTREQQDDKSPWRGRTVDQ